MKIKWADALKIAAPLALAFVPNARPFIPMIVKGIEIVEQMGEDNPELKPLKRDILREIVATSASTVNVATKSEAFDPDELAELVNQNIDVVIKATNELHRKMN